MPRDGSQQYHVPSGTLAITNYTVESTKYNAFTADLEQDLNLPRPIVAGGTGASSASGALFNLGGEIAAQVITNWDSAVWSPGSFYAATTASGTAPVAGHAFAGLCYINEPLANPPTNHNVIIEAVDLTATSLNKYVRVMTAGVWGAWATINAGVFVSKGGDTMTGLLLLSGDPAVALGAATKQYVDNTTVGTAGDTMTGLLLLSGDPAVALGAATKQYVDSGNTTRLAVAGGQTVTGGYRFTSYNAGTVSSGTFTPDAYNGNYQYYTNNGAHTLAVPASDCAIDILITNGASAGALTMAGGYTFGANIGDPYVTTNGSKFIFSIRRINAISTFVAKALQ